MFGTPTHGGCIHVRATPTHVWPAADRLEQQAAAPTPEVQPRTKIAYFDSGTPQCRLDVVSSAPSTLEEAWDIASAYDVEPKFRIRNHETGVPFQVFRIRGFETLNHTSSIPTMYRSK